MTDKPDAEEMINQTSRAAAESFAPIADMVIRNAIAGELHRAYGDAMDELAVLAEMNHQTWTPPKPLVIGTVADVREAIDR
jgi:hypothetical protein